MGGCLRAAGSSVVVSTSCQFLTCLDDVVAGVCTVGGGAEEDDDDDDGGDDDAWGVGSERRLEDEAAEEEDEYADRRWEEV